MAAFLLIVAVGGFVISLLISTATQSAFSLYTTRSGQLWVERLVPNLTSYYITNGSWDGVDTVITETLSGYSTSESQSSQNGMGQGHGPGTGGQPFASGGMMGMMNQQLILADGQGVVVYDSLGELTGQTLSQSDLEKGTAITDKEEHVGTILITPQLMTAVDTAESEFLSSIRKAIISSALIASVIALILGSLLSIQITAPMRKLHKAAAAIAKGDLDQRVDIKGKDEFGELGNTFNLMAENLSKAEIQRQHLMADVAHELRTPLAAIQGTLEAMQDGVLPCDREQVDVIYSETQLLNRLIGDLRLLSLAEASQLKLERQQIDINLLVQQAADRFQVQTMAKEQQLETKCQAGMPVISLDPDRITQVINNLISNALQYTPLKGSILVETFFESNTKRLGFSVSDTGPGIERADLAHVFDRFYRADKSRSRVSGGSGLGLAIVKELVEAHGGSVKVESPIHKTGSQMGHGTRFVVEFPLE